MDVSEISKRLKKQINFVKSQGYEVLCIGPVKPIPYDLFLTEKLVDSLVVVIPTFENIYKPLDKKYILMPETNEVIILKTLMEYKELLLQHKIYYIHYLYGKGMIVNNKYRYYIDYLKEHKEDIVKSNKTEVYKSIIDTTKSVTNRLITYLDENKYKKDMNTFKLNFFELLRLRNMFKNLINGLTFRESLTTFEQEDIELLTTDKLSKLSKTELHDLVSLYYTKTTNNVFDMDKNEHIDNTIANNINQLTNKLLIDVICNEYNIGNKQLNINQYDNIYFTSDLHFGHKNIIEYEHRDIGMNIFPTIENHDNKLIYNWNSVVKNNDLVFILGDLSFYNAETTNNIIKRLNGHKVLIVGNHDSTFINKKLFDTTQFELITDYLQINYKGIIITMMHYPIMSYDGMYKEKGYIHLFGHIHSVPHYTLPKHSYNVGVDVNNYKPIHIDKCIELAMSNDGNLLNKDLIK